MDGAARQAAYCRGPRAGLKPRRGFCRAIPIVASTAQVEPLRRRCGPRRGEFGVDPVITSASIRQAWVRWMRPRVRPTACARPALPTTRRATSACRSSTTRQSTSTAQPAPRARAARSRLPFAAAHPWIPALTVHRGQALSTPRGSGAGSTTCRVDGNINPHYVVPVGADREIGLKREAGADATSKAGTAPQRYGKRTLSLHWARHAPGKRQPVGDATHHRRRHVPSPKTCRQPRDAHRAVTGHGVFGGRRSVSLRGPSYPRPPRRPSWPARHPVAGCATPESHPADSAPAGA